MKIQYIGLILALVALCGGCGPATEEPQSAGLPKLVATTGMIQDAITHIAGEGFVVEGLMGPGVDPHLYKATRGDLTKLREAEVIFYNGLHLEGKMGEVLEKLSQQKTVITLGKGIPEEQLIYHGDNKDSKDPHIWFDVSLWIQAVSYASQELAKQYPDKAELFQKNTAAYLKELEELHSWTAAEIQTIPQEQRVLITAHDAFSYFGKAYDIEVKGLQGISTVAEFGLKDIKELVDYIVERRIKAVFVESSIPVKSLEAVVSGCKEKGHEINIGGTLYSDAMGDKGTDAGNYPGMVRTNVNTIVQALR